MNDDNNISTFPNTSSVNSLSEVREHIDTLDKEIVRLLIKRSAWVARAASFKPSRQAVRIPERIESVVRNALRLTRTYQGNDVLIERIYRGMIEAYIAFEETVYDQLHQEKNQQKHS